MIRTWVTLGCLFTALVCSPPLQRAEAQPGKEAMGPGFVNVMNFGADNTGEAEATAAVQSAIAALPAKGGTIYFPAGTYLVGTISLPNDPKVVNILGVGDATILKMAKAAGPLIGKVASDGRITGAKISNFTILANPGSVKSNLGHIAVNVVGFGNSTFEDITYKSSDRPTASVGVLFNIAAYPFLTYRNTFRRIKATQNFGPSRVFFFNNAGKGVNANANISTIDESWIYANAGIDVIIDGGDTTILSVSQNLLESNPGATAVILGQSTIVEGNWFELNGTAIATSSARSLDGSGSTIRDNYFSGETKIFIDSINIRPLFYGNSGGVTPASFSGQGVVRLGEPISPLPDVSTLSGGDGRLSLVSAAVTAVADMNGEFTETLEYINTPASSSPKNFTVSVPKGYIVKGLNVGVVRQFDGDPKPVAISIPLNTFWTSYTTTDAHKIVVQVTFKLQRPVDRSNHCGDFLNKLSARVCGGLEAITHRD